GGPRPWRRRRPSWRIASSCKFFRLSMLADIPAGQADSPAGAEPNPTSSPATAFPPRLRLDDLHAMPMAALLIHMRDWNVRIRPEAARHQLTADILRQATGCGVEVTVDGVLEMNSDAHGFLRWPRYSFRPGPEDIYVPAAVIRRFGLQ